MRKRLAWPILATTGLILLLLLLRGGIFRGDTDLAGVDANQDGVRDDVETFINEHYADERVRMAARHLHQGIQAAILDPAGHDTNMILCASGCLADLTGKRDVGAEIEAATANTRARIRQYVKAEARDSGKIIGCPLDFKEACAYAGSKKR